MGDLLIFAGVLGIGFGLVNLARPIGRWRITTRRQGAAVVGASFVVVLLGTGIQPPGEDPATAAAPTSTTSGSTATTPTPTTTTVARTTTTSAPAATTTSLLTTTISTPDIPHAEVIFAGPAAGLSGDPAAAVPPGSETMTVTGITDGDTVEVRLSSAAVETVRLIGVNSPESGECFSDEAALVLAALVPVGTEIAATIDTSERDQYDRLLRYLWVGGLSVNEELVRRGAAIARRYPPDTALASRFESAQPEAQQSGLGLWEPDACGPDAGTEIAVVAIEADSPGNDNETLEQEIVRLANGGTLAVDMTGWVLKDESATHRYQFPTGFTLAGGAAVSVHTGCGADDDESLYWCNDGAVWNNDGDTAFVLDHNGNIVHSLQYQPAAEASSVPITTVAAFAATPTTTPASTGCHPSYTGACVPITSDVDCRGGSGNGPEYVGRVTVVGPDEYDLDGNDDGVGCE